MALNKNDLKSGPRLRECAPRRQRESGGGINATCKPFFSPALYPHRSARSTNTTEEESCAEDFEFAEGSAQFWVSRNVGDGIVLPKDTRDTLDRDYECAILR